jgi:hypothetical protein
MAASFSCAVTILVSVFSLFGFDLFSLLDGAIFGIIAWRIYKLSFSWSIVGLLFFVAERVEGLHRGLVKVNAFGWIFAGALTMCYLNSIRATWFLRKNRKLITEPTEVATSRPLDS